MLYEFKLQSFHRYGQDRFGEWISSGRCNFIGDNVVGIEVFRYYDGRWQKRIEMPTDENIELQQMVFAAEQMRKERRNDSSRATGKKLHVSQSGSKASKNNGGRK